MTIPLYFPADELGGQTKDFDLAADYVELSSFFSSDGIARLSDLINASEIGADSEYASVDDEITSREEIVAGAINVIEARRSSLAEAYPFQLSDDGRELALQRDLNVAGGRTYSASLFRTSSQFRLSSARAVSTQARKR